MCAAVSASLQGVNIFAASVNISLNKYSKIVWNESTLIQSFYYLTACLMRILING